MAAFAEDTVANDVSTADALTAALADTSEVTTINLAEGATIKLTSTLQTNKDGVVINGNGATLDFTGVAKESWGLLINSNNVQLSNVTIIRGSEAGTNNTVKVSAEKTNPNQDRLTGVKLTGVTINGGGGLDVYNSDAELNGVTVNDSIKAGIALSHGAVVTGDNVTIDNPAWGGFGLMYSADRDGDARSTLNIPTINYTGDASAIYCEKTTGTPDQVSTSFPKTYAEDGRTFYLASVPTVAVIDSVNYADLASAVKDVKSGQTISLSSNAVLSSMLTINVPDVTLDLGNNIISAADDFAFTDNNSRHLVDITANGVVLRNGTLSAGANNNHTLNVWNAQNVQLANLKLDNSAAGVGGAPLIVGASDVTVTGPLETVTGPNSWYAINVDSRVVSGSNVSSKLTAAENSALTFSGSNPDGICMENTASTSVEVAFQPNVTVTSDITGFVPIAVKSNAEVTVTDPENAGIYENEDGGFTTTPPVMTVGTVTYSGAEYEAVFANGNSARVYEKDGKTCVEVTDRDGNTATHTFETDRRVVFGGSNVPEGGEAVLPETNIVMDGGKVNYLFGASHTTKNYPISINAVRITVNGGTVNMVQTAEQGGGMGSFDKCGDYYVDTSDIEINGGKIGAVVGGAYGYTQVEHVFVTVNGGEINPGDLTSPVQAGILLAGTNGKVGTATLHMKNGTVNGLAVGQRCYVTSGVTYNLEGGSVGDVYLGSYYPVATEGSAAWETWGSPTSVGNINYGQVAGKFTVNIGGTKLNGLYPGYQYLPAEREAIKDPALVKGSIPTGADNADTAKTPVSIALLSNAQSVPSYILGSTAVTLTPNHRYELTAGSSDVLSMMTSEVIAPVTVVTTSVDIPSTVEYIFNALLDGDQKTGCELTSAAKDYLEKHAGDSELKVQVLANNLADSAVPASEKALITAKGAIAQYIDISLVLSSDGTPVQDAKITKTGQPLYFNVEIPASLVKDGRTFKIVSVHEGKLIEYPTTVTTENGVTVASFSSDSFSTYGLIFTDASSGNGNNGGSSSTAGSTSAPVLDSTPKTGAVSLAALPLAALAFAGMGLVLRKRED